MRERAASLWHRVWKRDCLNNGKTDSLGGRGPAWTDGRTEGWTDRRWRCPRASPAAPARPPVPLGALHQRQERRQRRGRSGDAPQAPAPSQPRSPQNACDNPHGASREPGRDAGSVPAQEGRGLWWREQFPLGRGQHRVAPPAEPPAALRAVSNAPGRLWNGPGGSSRSRGCCRVPAVPRCVPSTPAVRPHPRHGGNLRSTS